MNSGDKIVIDGRATAPSELCVDLQQLLCTSYIYQRIHALGSEPMYPDIVLELAASALGELYGKDLRLDREQLCEDILLLLKENSYPVGGSSMITLFVFPSGNISYALMISSQLLYRGYTIWHTAQRAAIVRYDPPFPRHKTGAALMMHGYAAEYVKKGGAEVALVEDSDGVLIGAGEYPLFVVSGNRIVTSPLTQGVADSVERRICIQACLKAGYRFEQEPIMSSRIGTYDELFYFAPQGIFPIRSCGESIYPDIVSRRIAAAL